MYDVLKRLGHDVRIFAEGCALKEPAVWPSPKVQRFVRKPADVLIYHYSRGWDPGLELLREVKCRTVIKYHNVTPPEFFARYNADYAHMCLVGREQIKPIARAGCDLYLSASEYNRRELLDEGADEGRSFVVPPFHHIDRLQDIAADLKVLDQYRDGKSNILMVGRVAPNKGHPSLIEAFAAYHHDYDRDSRLIIVGKEETRLRNYSALLREMVKRLKLDGAVKFTGGVSDSTLKAYYQCADLFMTASEHEGFCVPLVEAMAMKVPIVAYASSAIPDTVGDAGLVWKERNPYLLAESVNAIVWDATVSTALGEMGRRRYERHYTNRKIETEFLSALGNLL
jgi:glycosyltransferase involved in cell wall biosynthesis